MKLKQLSIKNITSIEDAVINFDASPLSNAPIFLITGPTGAGKTSILDAICLALYGTTPRLLGKNEGVYNSSESNNSAGTNRVDNPAHMLRRGAGLAEVKLEFIGNDDCPYLATWSVNRARNKINGNLQTPKRFLQNVKLGISYDKVRDIDSKILEITGFEIEQFCRTTMLAQGEFNKFLTAEVKDRCNILEKLTGTDIYSKIGITIHNSYKESKRAYEELSNKIQLLQGQQLSEEEYNTLSLKIESLQTEITSLNNQLTQKQSISKWLEHEQSLNTILKEAQSNKEQCTREAQSPEVLARIALLERWESSRDIRLTLERCNTLQEEKHSIEHQQEDCRLDYYHLCAQIQAVQKNLEDTKSKIADLEAIQTSYEPHRGMYDNFANIQGALQAYEAEVKRIQEAKNTQQKLQQQFENLKPQLEQADEQVKQSKRIYEDLEQEQNALQAAYDQQKHDDLSQLIKWRKEAEEAEKQLQEKKSERDELEAKHQDKVKEVGEIEQQLQTYAQTLKQQEELYEERKTKFDASAWSMKELCQSIRAKLHKGDTCPVCMNEINHIVSETEVQAVLKPYEDELKQCQKDIFDTKSQHSELEGALNSAKKEVDNLNKKHLEALKNCQEQQNTIDAILQKQEAIQIDVRELSTELLQEEEFKYEALKKQILDKTTAVNEQRKSYDKTLSVQQGLQKQEQEFTLQLSTCEHEIQTAEQNQARQLNLAREFITLDKSEWYDAWQSAPTVWLEQIKSEKQAYDQRNLNLQIEKTKQQTLEQDLQSLQNIAEDIQKNEPTWTNLQLADFIPKLLDKSILAQLSGKVISLKQSHGTVSKELTNLSNQIANYCTEQGLSREELQALNQNKDIERLQDEERKRKDREQMCTTTLKNHENLYQEHLKRAPRAPEAWEQIEGSELNDAINTLNELITAKNQELGQDQQKRKDHEEQANLIKNEQAQYEKLHLEYEQWATLNNLYGASDGSNFRRIAQSFVLEQLLRAANVHLACFIPHYELQCSEPGQLTILIHNKLNNSLIGVPNLSGGESFIVSLALALGLSQVGNKGLSIDTLFIDEGFGTLSSEALDLVMTALETLRKESGCRVGIISHVDSLKDRIPTQIQLQRQDATKSRIKIVGN